MPETEVDIVGELKPGMWVWFADDNGEGFRKAWTIFAWHPAPCSAQYDLAREWVTITFVDGHFQDRPRYGTHEIWKSGPCPQVRS